LKYDDTYSDDFIEEP